MEARYRLSAARELRARDERAKRWDLMGAVSDAEQLAACAAQASERVARYSAAIGDVLAARDRLLAGGATAAALGQLERYVTRLRRDRAAAQGEALRAQARRDGQTDAVDAARGQLRLARAEREVIERHFAAWRNDQRKRADRAED